MHEKKHCLRERQKLREKKHCLRERHKLRETKCTNFDLPECLERNHSRKLLEQKLAVNQTKNINLHRAQKKLH